LGVIAEANRRYAPEMYETDYMETIADAFESGDNYAVFDLNINIRKLREEQWKRLDHKPRLLVLGASQWQEAHKEMLPGHDWLNGHVHRDYYEDVLGMVELLVRHDKLPKDMVITVRDRLFTPVASRTDYLWLPGIPYYQAMADRLSLPRLSFLETYPLQRPRELLSLPMLFNNATRWHNAKDWPYPTTKKQLAVLDVLHPDGSITWSEEHRALFTQERSERLAVAHADASRNKPPVIDPKGVEALDRLLAYLAVRGVRVHLAHPPFNPIFFERVQGSPFMRGLADVEAVTRELAAKHKLNIVGSFDPSTIGCTAEMYIDAEHSSGACLEHLLGEIADSVDLPAPAVSADLPVEVARLEHRSRMTLMKSGWMGSETSLRHVAAAALVQADATPAKSDVTPEQEPSEAAASHAPMPRDSEVEAQAEAETPPASTAGPSTDRAQTEPVTASEETPATTEAPLDATPPIAEAAEAKPDSRPDVASAGPSILPVEMPAATEAVAAAEVAKPLVSRRPVMARAALAAPPRRGHAPAPQKERAAKPKPVRRAVAQPVEHKRIVKVARSLPPPQHQQQQQLIWPGDRPVRYR
ncbi:MAG: hypothetical protein AB7O57_20705, partial [Hyphomicrobiaceae bacterium]